MPTVSALRKPVASRRSASVQPQKFVPFTFEGVVYTLDLARNRVYRNWMAVETNKGFTILGAYRTTATLSA